MKKILALLLVLAMALSLVACGGNAETPATEAPATEALETTPAAEEIVEATDGPVKTDEISADEKASIQSAVDHLKEVNKGTDVAAIKAATEEVQQAFYKVSEKLYQQANPNGAQGAQGGYTQPDDGVVDADYETVD